ncbi:MAG: TetR/AcrR family transcriptional regulator [Spirochaetes bacterium]|nr:TetR/AcrR family transcriptional regulator [Spirochaetota bacterium]
MVKKSGNIIKARAEADEKLLSRERILSAAKRVFAESGYQGARLGSIARKASVNQALIHYYFASKDNLYQEVLRRLFGVDEIIDLPGRFSQWSLSPAEQLMAALYFMVHFHHDGIDPDFNKIVAREIAEGRANIKSLVSIYILPRIETIESIILNGVKAGVFETRHPMLTVFNIISLVISYESNRENYRDTPLFGRLYNVESHDEFFAFVVEYIFKALKPEGKKLKIPELPETLTAMIDSTIMELKQRQKWLEL